MRRLIGLGVVPVLCFMILTYSAGFEKNAVQSSVNELSPSTLPAITETSAEETPAAGSAEVVLYPDIKDEFSTYKEDNRKMAGSIQIQL